MARRVVLLAVLFGSLTTAAPVVRGSAQPTDAAEAGAPDLLVFYTGEVAGALIPGG